eukprot:CAMPEP_0201544436 /NCGR_PEP_ID=MMETSP0173_2-20130828/1045_1 /ASSEMBLY_ACC=CAM_ASM_000268 /TAXON_ID=218659 /ORGANISM="Vexillifera sp., Strain DIVA3 564/2" /LENGTH=212 /DNA_ID=CAMNT_0047952545 /DNA_START=79 /DNA_END=717 /DNA_ORIENTATION=+
MAGLGKLNGHLKSKNYIAGGYEPTAADFTTFESVNADLLDKFVNVSRWYNHIATFSDEQKSAFSSASSAAAPAAAAGGADEDDDSDVDLFASDDDADAEWEAEKAKRQADADAKKAAAKKAAPVLKSIVVLDVKPWDGDQDLEELEQKIRTVEIEGLEWKASETKEIAFGVKKIVISCHIVDDLVSVDDIQEKIEAFEDDVQSTDVVTFTKL